MQLVRRMVLGTAFFGMFLAALPAKAEFQVCNHTSMTAYVAFGHWDNRIYTTQGWRIAHPGSCVITYPGDLEWQWYFIFARTADESGSYNVWSGDVPLCINWPNGFTIVGNELCDTNFIKIDIRTEKSWTFTLE